MLQAWLVLPALYPRLPAGRAVAGAWRAASGTSRSSALVALVVSLSWMLVVTAVPAHDRPYVDGSCNDSVFSQVFLYNGTDRLTGDTLDQAGCGTAPAPVKESGGTQETTIAVPQGPGRFLNGIFGRDSDWMLLPASVALGGILVARRREPRTDPLRARRGPLGRHGCSSPGASSHPRTSSTRTTWRRSRRRSPRSAAWD